MIIDQKMSLTPAPATASVPSRPADNLRSGLGMLGQWQVNSIERREKVAAAGALVKKTVEITRDVETARLEIEATVVKSANMARAVPVLGGLLDELVVRTSDVRLDLEATEHAGMVAEIKARHQRQGDYSELFASGQMTESELAEMITLSAQRTTQGCTRLLRDVDRAHEGLDAHLGRVISHLTNASKERR